MAFDIRKWLIEDMKFSPAEADEMAPKFTGDRASTLEAGYVAGNDRAAVAAARQEIQAAQTKLDEANARLNSEIAEWATLSASEKEHSTALRASLEQSQRDVLGLRQTVERLATQAGVDPKTVLETPKPEVVVPESKTPAFDPNKFVSADTFAELTRFNFELPAALQYIADQHRELTGSSLDTRTIVAEIKARAGKKDAIVDPVAIWEEKYGIPAIRAKREADARAAEIAAAEARGEERARTAMSIPGQSTVRSARPSPVLGPRDAAARTSVLKRPTPESGLHAAASAFRTGKYRQQKTA